MAKSKPPILAGKEHDAASVSEPANLLRAARAGLRVLELPVAHRRRAGGISKVSGSLGVTLKASWRILPTFVRVALERRRPPTATAPAPEPAR